MKVSADLLKTIALTVTLPMISIGCQSNDDSLDSSLNSTALIEDDDTTKKNLTEENRANDSIGLGTIKGTFPDTSTHHDPCPLCGKG